VGGRLRPLTVRATTMASLIDRHFTGESSEESTIQSRVSDGGKSCSFPQLLLGQCSKSSVDLLGFSAGGVL
jgi:hypothetical protein